MHTQSYLVMIPTSAGNLLASIDSEYMIEDTRSGHFDITVKLPEQATLTASVCKRIADGFMQRLPTIDPYLAGLQCKPRYLFLSYPIPARSTLSEGYQP